MTTGYEEFLPEIKAAVMSFIDKVPFNQLVGMKITNVTPNLVEMHLPMKEDLIGNYITGILHGGVISSMIDVSGGAMALVGAFRKLEHVDIQERIQRLARVSTIDLRVDYLRPGRGESFYVSSTLLRSGNKVAVTRSEFYNNRNDLCAVGTGTYLCG
ncbi:thioesterase family protein [Spartinivicinus poritis]|uniref:Medium/long-chain acyl-CoA thioesterase YigI n=1 Tax=Spartinivicinus poritis TaxID=2994640 RepID=A0ABT5U832_9GAMM|nr:thioesterase family protein [Spartinivicinus sp. A2-2]MDE1462543.1 thioesterase family protein [Spartinivicinus sp. A2-2]